MSIVAALTREHRDIDARLEEFAAGVAEGDVRAEILTTATAGLRRHIYLEEEFLFPPIQAAGLMMPIQVMLREHGQIWPVMDRLDAMVADHGALDRNRDEALAACRELLALLDQHNSKEEPIVYPRAEVDLPPNMCEELTQFLRTGRMPDGWVCRTLSADY